MVKWIVLGALLVSCTVNRKSEQFSCTDSQSCNGNRSCVNGFCVDNDDTIDALPSGCNSTTKMCDFTCTTFTPCTGMCPAGFSCSYDCLMDGGCPDDINCTEATSCTISCQAGHCQDIHCGSANCDITCASIGGGCGDITCGSGSCKVQCSGNNACGNVTCNQSCECDVTGCDTSTCGNLNCPSRGGHCTTDGTSGMPCDSSHSPSCNTCP